MDRSNEDLLGTRSGESLETFTLYRAGKAFSVPVSRTLPHDVSGCAAHWFYGLIRTHRGLLDNDTSVLRIIGRTNFIDVLNTCSASEELHLLW